MCQPGFWGPSILDHCILRTSKFGCCCYSVAKLCPTLCAHTQASLSFTISHSLLKLIHVHWVSDAIQPSHPLSSPSPAFSLSQHQGFFQWVSFSHQVAKVLNLQLQHQPFQWYSGLIFFRIDWFDFLAVQGTGKSLFQHHNLRASILQCSGFFMVQLSHSYMTTGKTIAWLYGPLLVKWWCLCSI